MDEQQLALVWEFLTDSIAFIGESKYKSVGKYMIEAWQREMQGRGISISNETHKIGSKNQMNVLIEFPFEHERHLSIWLENHKTRMEDLIQALKKFEDLALTKLRAGVS